MKQFLSFLKKEFYHIFRDLRTTIIMMILPVVLVVLFGYAISTEIKDARLAVFDQSRDQLTQRITDRLSANDYFDLFEQVDSYAEIDNLFRKNRIQLSVVFPPRFAEHPVASSVQILADASSPNEATSLINYASTIISNELTEGTDIAQQGITPVVQLLYNPQMKDSYNFVPGVMGMILILICSLMTSVGIVREKEYGSMEVLLVSPMKPIYIILAKAVPYLLISLINIGTILLLAYYLLDVPIKGNLFVVVMLSVLYALTALTLGLLISTVANTQKAAMLICAMMLMLPVMLLSGMIFPIENMPWPLQLLSYIVPARWYITALRDVMIKGLSFSAILPEIGILVFMVCLLLALSVKRFKIRLE